MQKIISSFIIFIFCTTGTAYANRALEQKLECLKDYIRCELKAQGCTIAKYGSNTYLEESKNSTLSQNEKDALISIQNDIDQKFEEYATKADQSIIESLVNCSAFDDEAFGDLKEGHCCLQKDEEGNLPSECSQKDFYTIEDRIKVSHKTLQLLHTLNKVDMSSGIDAKAEAEKENFNPCNVKLNK